MPAGPGKFRGSSLSYASAADFFSSNAVYGREDKSSANTEAVYTVKMETVTNRHPSETLMTRLSECDNLLESQAFSTSKTEHFERLEQGGRKRTEMISVKHVMQNVDRSAINSDFESVSSSSVVSKRNIDSTMNVGSYVSDNQTDRTSRTSEKLSPNRQPRFV